MSKFVFNAVLVVAGLIALYVIGAQIVAEKKIPSFGDLMASSSALFASSTGSFSSSARSSSDASAESPTPGLSTGMAGSIPSTLAGLSTTTVLTPKGALNVFVADTEAEREQGLSDVASLPPRTGMLFVFDEPGVYDFWMKDMQFPLDMVWIDSHKVVRDITANALPRSYPSTFASKSPISYVIEMDAGASAAFGLKEGSSVRFSLPE